MGKRDTTLIIVVIMVGALVLGTLRDDYTGAFSLLDFLFGRQMGVREGGHGGTTAPEPEPKDPYSPPPAGCDWYDEPNALGDHCYGDCNDAGTYCAPKEGATHECICRASNPCVTVQGHPTAAENLKCMACMAYAEAGGANIPDGCMWAVACVIDNRVKTRSYRPRVQNACEAVAQGDGLQFEAYRCAGDLQYANQKYCNCGRGTITNPAELQEVNSATAIVQNLDCTGFSATFYNNVGQTPKWMKVALKEGRCKRVNPSRTCQNVFEFFTCS